VKESHEVKTFEKKVQLLALKTNYINSSNMILTNQDKGKKIEITQQSHNHSPSQDVLGHKNLMFFFLFLKLPCFWRSSSW